MFRFIANLSIRCKLSVLILLPLLGFICFSGNHLFDTYQEKVTLDEMKILTEAATVSALLVHELQKERGATAGFLGSKGEKFGDILAQQRQQTDINITSLNQFINKSKLPDSLNQLFLQINSELNKVNHMRQRVDQLSVSVKEEVDFYTHLNERLLSIIDNTANNNSDIQLSLSATAIGSFLQHKERAGIERAVMSNVFAADDFTPALLEKFIRLLAEQDAYLAKFKAHASPTQLEIYKLTVQGTAVEQVEKYRQLALKNMATGGFGVDATVWFTTITKKINLLKKVEVALLDQISNKNQQLIAQANSQLIIVAFIILISLMITLLISLLIFRQLSQSINEITVKLKCIVKSNNLTTRIKINSTEELGEIGDTINLLVDHLQNLVGDIQSTSNTLTTSLSANANHTHAIANKIDGGSDQVTQVVTATTEMSSTVAEIARNAIEAAHETEQAAIDANKSNHQVTATINNISQLEEELNKASAVISKLHNKSSDIGKFINVIKQISEQTNLLALNAAIEAARAGESGRGFAVVADEVRSLAMQTNRSTKEIETMISELQANSAAANSAMQNGIKMVLNSVQDVQQTGQNIVHINTNITKITQMNEQIAAAAEEQSCVTEEINRNMVNIQDGYADMHQSYDQISQGSAQLELLANQLNKNVEQFIIK